MLIFVLFLMHLSPKGKICNISIDTSDHNNHQSIKTLTSSSRSAVLRASKRRSEVWKYQKAQSAGRRDP